MDQGLLQQLSHEPPKNVLLVRMENSGRANSQENGLDTSWRASKEAVAGHGLMVRWIGTSKNEGVLWRGADV